MTSRNRLIALSITRTLLLLGSLVAFSSVAWAQGGGSAVIRLISAPNPAVQAQPVTFSAFVSSSGGGPIPTGAVTFSEGTVTLAATQLDATGAATWTISTLSVGSHTINAAYAGDSNFAPATAQPLVQTILSSFKPTTTIVHSSLNPSSVGQSVTFTAQITLASSPTNPTGLVTFYDGNANLGTAPVITSGSGEEFVHLATLPPNASLAEGSHSIQAVYSGNNIYAGSTSAVLVQVVQSSAFATTTALSSSLNPSVAGQSTTFTVSVSSGSGTPTGVVTVTDGKVLLATLTLDGNGQAKLSISSLSTGTHNITANYGGDSNFAASASAVLSQIVQPPPAAATTTVLTSSLNPSTSGDSVALEATVTPQSGTSIPTGSVDFLDGSELLGTSALDKNGVASLTTSSLSVASHQLTARYAGNADFGVSSGVLTQVVNPPTNLQTNASLQSSSNPSSYGQAISFIVVVTDSSGTGGTPTGTVTISAGSITATATLDNLGQAVLTTSALPVGNTTVTVLYAGDSTFAGSTSSPLVQVVNPAFTAIQLTSSANPSSYGQAISFTATVSSDGGTPTGTLTFSVGSNTISATLNASGQAIYSGSSLPPGNITVSAAYSGDGNFSPSSSGVITQTVGKASTQTTLTSSLRSAPSGTPITFTARVSGNNAGTPSGNVQFQEGMSTLGEVTLTAGQATLTLTNLTIGTHNIVAVYAGDSNFQQSTSQVLSQVVIAAPASADLALTQTISAKRVERGDSLEYRIKVVNNGPASARGLVLTDILPNGTVFRESEANKGACKIGSATQASTLALTCRLDTLAPTSSAWIVQLEVKVIAPKNSILQNTATVVSATSDPKLVNNTATATATVAKSD